MTDQQTEDSARSIREPAEKTRSSGPLAEFAYFLRRSRKWWMAPIIGMLLLVRMLLVMAGTAAGSRIYALF